MRNFQEIGRSIVYSLNGLAATSHPLASCEAISILKKGGNAVDAAIAASLVLSVVEPQSTGIGGDCFALIHTPDAHSPISINGSGKAASYSDISYFNQRNIKNIDINSVHSITIPGSIDAWSTMSKKWGKLPWNELFKSSINYANNGFVVFERIAYDWEESKQNLQHNENTSKTFLKSDGTAYKVGNIFKNPKLGKSLEIIATQGRNAFYEGDIAKDIVSSLQKVGGLHTLQDLQQQNTLVLDPIKVSYKDKTLYQCPPNNQGITTLIIMKILEEMNINQYPAMSFERFHLEGEATKIAYYLRDHIVGDNIYNKDHSFTKVLDYDKYLNKAYLSKLRNMIKMDKCLKPFENFERILSPDTVYLTVIDKDKNVVSMINSIFHSFGSGITTDNTGIVLHNRGACFTLENGHINCIAPGKRPLHTIMPGMVYKNNRFLLSYGVMGGQYQPVGQIQFLNNFLEFNMNIQESLNFPRAFHFGDKFQLEKRVSKEIEEKLKKIGHRTIRIESPLGGGQAIGINWENVVCYAGSDPRKDGCALGY